MGRQPKVEEITGVRTIKDAVEACKRSGLAGWALVAYAQRKGPAPGA